MMLVDSLMTSCSVEDIRNSVFFFLLFFGACVIIKVIRLSRKMRTVDVFEKYVKRIVP